MMSAFKRAVASDVGNVFLNQDEFAEIHELGEQRTPLLCIIDTDLTGQLGAELGTRSAFSGHVGVFSDTLTLYVKSSDLLERLVEGEPFRIDGGYHIVHSVSDEDGVLAIICEAHEQ